MLLFVLVTFLWYVHFLIELREYMKFIKKYWRELLIGILVIVVIILSVWIGVTIKEDPLAKYKLKEFDNVSRKLDSIVKESEIITGKYVELAKKYEDSSVYWGNLQKPTIIYRNNLNQQKNEEVNNIDKLTVDSVGKLFSSEAEYYIKSAR